MSGISDSETALLLLLAEGPAHPYQIEKEIRERSMDYWTELSQSSIYKILRQLEKKGFAESSVALNERNVGRKTYSLTEAGLEAVKATLREFLSVPEKAIWRIDLATSHLDLLAPEEAAAALASYRVEVEKLAQGYRDLEAYLMDEGCPEHAMALARRPLHLYEAELKWLGEYRERLREVGTLPKERTGQGGR